MGETLTLIFFFWPGILLMWTHLSCIKIYPFDHYGEVNHRQDFSDFICFAHSVKNQIVFSHCLWTVNKSQSVKVTWVQLNLRFFVTDIDFAAKHKGCLGTIIICFVLALILWAWELCGSLVMKCFFKWQDPGEFASQHGSTGSARLKFLLLACFCSFQFPCSLI